MGRDARAATDEAADFAARIVALQDVARGLQTRLHYARKTLASPGARPTALTSPAYAKLRRALDKKFPRLLGDKIAFRDPKDALAMRTELRDHYLTLVNVYKLKRNAHAILEHAANLFTRVPQVTSVSQVLWGVLRLLTVYFQLHVQLVAVKDKRLIAAMYRTAAISAQESRDAETKQEQRDRLQYEAVAAYLVALGDDAVRFIQTEFDKVPALTLFVRSALLALASPYLTSSHIDAMISQGVLEIQAENVQCSTGQPDIGASERAAATPADVRTYLPCLCHEEVHAWICFGLLSCPESLVDPSTSDGSAAASSTDNVALLHLLRVALSTSCVATVFRDETLRVDDAFQRTFAAPGPKQNRAQKKARLHLIAQVGASALQFALRHEQRCAFLVTVLEKTLAALRIDRGILGPKGPTILSALAMSRAEILTNARYAHSCAQASSQSPSRVTLAKLASLPKLMALHLQVAEFLSANEFFLTAYTSECLRTMDVADLEGIVADMPPSDESGSDMANVRAQLVALQEALEDQVQDTARVSHASIVCDRAEIALLVCYGQHPTARAKHQVWLSAALACVVGIAMHQILVNDLYSVIAKRISLHDLVFFRPLLDDSLKKALASEQDAKYALAYVRALQDSVFAQHRFCPEEIALLSRYATQTAVARMRTILQSVENAMDAVLAARLASAEVSSAPRLGGEQALFDGLVLGLAPLTPQTLIIWNVELAPREYVRTLMAKWLARIMRKSFFQDLGADPAAGLQSSRPRRRISSRKLCRGTSAPSTRRPSECCKRIAIALDVLALVGSASGIDHTVVARQVVFEQTGGTNETWLESMARVPRDALRAAAAAHARAHKLAAKETGAAATPGRSAASELPLSEMLACWLVNVAENVLGTAHSEDPAAGLGGDGGGSSDGRGSARSVGQGIGEAEPESKRSGTGLEAAHFAADASYSTMPDKEALALRVIPGRCTSSPTWLMQGSGIGVPGILLAPHRDSYVVVRHAAGLQGKQRRISSGRLSWSPMGDADANPRLRRKEFAALATLLGARGLRVVERHLLAVVATQTSLIFELLQRAYQGLGELRRALTCGCEPLASKIVPLCESLAADHGPGICSSIAALVTAGHALSLLDVVQRAHRDCLTSRGDSSGFTAAQSVPGSEWTRDEHTACGPDVMLMAALADVPTSNLDLWCLLPYLVAASLCTKAWRSADVIPEYDGLANNMHVAPLALRKILHAIFAAPRSPDDDKVLRDLCTVLESHAMAVGSVAVCFEQVRLSETLWPFGAVRTYLGAVARDATAAGVAQMSPLPGRHVNECEVTAGLREALEMWTPFGQSSCAATSAV